MTLVRVKPTVRRRPVHSFSFDRWLDELFDVNVPGHSKTRNRNLTNPLVNIVEVGEAFHIQIAAPGMAKEDFEIQLDKDVLTVNGKKDFNPQEGETFRRKEFGAYDFTRRFRLPETLDGGAVEANYSNGVLDISIPKKEEAKEKPARKIDIA